MEELVSARIFSHWQVVQAQFLGLCMHFLAFHVTCLFVFYCKGIAGNVFSNLPDQMVHPLEEPIKHYFVKREGQPQCYGKDPIT